ncbi:hypothetical protein [Vreelandella venusta]|uniref:hypothetical protein n=1 Tax=Vreelandella venusta TaxID=44935 RepID=UPI003F66E9B2
MDRHKWDVWVSIAWIAALIVCASSAYLVYIAGMVRVPVASLSGYSLSSREEINWFIWAIGIGQSVGAILFAALINIANNAYQNTCDLLSGKADARIKTTPKSVEPPPPISGVRIDVVPRGTPLDGKLPAGYFISSVNGVNILERSEIDSNVVAGKNTIVVTSPNGKESSMVVKAPEGTLGL